MKEAVLVFPHQLFKEHPALAKGRRVFLIEDPLYFSQYRFHKQKLVLHRASMKAYEAFLISEGYVVEYISHVVAKRGILEMLRTYNIGQIHSVEVVDDWLEKSITRAASEAEVPLTWYATPQFLTNTETVRAYWNSDKRHLHHAFYVWQRKRLNVLVENDKPVGGHWSYDALNRKRLPKEYLLPKPYTSNKTIFVDEASLYVVKEFPHHYGDSTSFAYAITHTEAEQRLQEFLSQRLSTFGAYEDAISQRDHELFHSVLSPYLNNGLLTPKQVLDAVLEHAHNVEIPLSSLEGFVRQLIGWREFIRMVYICNGSYMRSQNVLGATKKLTSAWWEGTTGLVPIDESISLLRAHAYTHHIVRLMVIGNAMTLLQIDPDDAYRWFMEWYIDAYDWVMVPNVYGMALYADGGSMVTKPYVSSSRYLLAMSDYPKGVWTEVWDALYWVFIERHEQLLSRNSRASLMVGLLKRLSVEKKNGYRLKADEVYNTITT